MANEVPNAAIVHRPVKTSQ